MGVLKLTLEQTNY